MTELAKTKNQNNKNYVVKMKFKLYVPFPQQDQKFNISAIYPTIFTPSFTPFTYLHYPWKRYYFSYANHKSHN